MSLIRDFIHQHENWEDLLSNKPYCLKISRDDEFIMFKYNQIESDFSIPLVCEARGIIFDESNWNIVCRGFSKFFNYGEPNAATIDWSSAEVTEKIDGSLIKVWQYKDKLHISTNGMIDAYKSETGNVIYPNFGTLFFAAVRKEQRISDAPSGHTMLFELVSPFTRVVVPYDDIAIYYLTTIVNETGEEYKNSFGYSQPKEYKMRTLQDVISIAEALPWDEEGYVVKDKNNNRIKIKSPKYVMAHYARNNNVITNKRLLEVILKRETEEFLVYAKEYEDVIEDLTFKIAIVELNVRCYSTHYCKYHSLTKKEFVKMIQEDQVEKKYWDYLFKKYEDPSLSWNKYVENWTVNKWAMFLEV